MLFLLAGLALAAPELIVVGVHVPGLVGNRSMDAAERLADAIESSGKARARRPLGVATKLQGRETLVLESFGLGPGRARVAEGRVLYDRAQVEEAIPVLAEGAELLAQGLAYAPAARELGDALVLLGMAYVGNGDTDEAGAAFERAATLDAARELDPVNFPPRVIDLYDEARGRVARQSPARLTVAASTGAVAWLDGRSLGTLPAETAIIPGEHYLLVRGKDGGSFFERLPALPGQSLVRDATLERRGIGAPAEGNAGRSKQVKELYKALGSHVGGGLVVLAGSSPGGQVSAQLYAPATGNFSKVLTGDDGGDAVAAICDLAPALVAYLNESGEIRADRVAPQVAALDISANDVLADLLFGTLAVPEPVAAVAPARTRGPPWWAFAAIGGAVVAGGGVAAAVLLAPGPGGGGDDGNDPDTDPDQGTIVFGPAP